MEINRIDAVTANSSFSCPYGGSSDAGWRVRRTGHNSPTIGLTSLRHGFTSMDGRILAETALQWQSGYASRTRPQSSVHTIKVQQAGDRSSANRCYDHDENLADSLL